MLVKSRIVYTELVDWSQTPLSQLGTLSVISESMGSLWMVVLSIWPPKGPIASQSEEATNHG